MIDQSSRAAIVVIDMQNDFCSAGGSLSLLGSDISRNEEVVRRLPHFLDQARSMGHLIVWVKQVNREALLSEARRARAKAMGRDPMAVCAEGSWGAEIVDGLGPATGDPVIEKTRYSAFVGTPLPNLLRAHGIDRLIVCGTAANVCVDSTIRDAYMSDYRVSMAADLVGWTRENLAKSAIDNLEFYFCDVVQSADLLSEWTR